MKERGEQAPRIFAIVDVETTGTRPLYDRIIDIAVLRVEDGIITRKINTLVNPGITIPSSIVPISNITNDMVAVAPGFDEIALELKDIFDGAIFVAHNAHFDYGFIKNEFRRMGISFKAPMLCTVKLSRLLHPQERSHDLDALINRYGISCMQRHRAFPDAYVLREWFAHIVERFGKSVVDEYIEKLLYADNLPPLLHRNVLKNLPDTAGIYFFYGKDRELLYVGKSKNIRTRVRSHFSGVQTGKEARLCKETAFVEIKETPGELSALLLESQTIKTHMPLYNRVLRRARNIVVAIQEKNKDGYYTVRLEQVSHVPEKETIVSIFRTMAQARSKLRDLAKEKGLCAKLLGIEQATNACFGAQIGRCAGACLGRETALKYNDRFKRAFHARVIKSWPYRGPVLIEEGYKREGVGTMFFVDQWRLVKSISYDHGDVQEFIPGGSFDYNTYKILARYILSPVNRMSIKEISAKELTMALKQINHSYETEIQYT